MDTSNRIVCGMVLGEASESEDESDSATSKETSLSGSQSGSSFLPNSSSRVGSKKSSRHKLKYNTLLHYRLRDDNISLRNDLVTAAEQPVIRAACHLTEALQIQTRTRNSLHEMPQYLHQLSVALVGLQDRLPYMCSAQIIPKK